MKALLIIAIVLQGMGIFFKTWFFLKGVTDKTDDKFLEGMMGYSIYGILPAIFFEVVLCLCLALV